MHHLLFEFGYLTWATSVLDCCHPSYRLPMIVEVLLTRTDHVNHATAVAVISIVSAAQKPTL